MAEHGPAPDDLEPLFEALAPDRPAAQQDFDAILDAANMPLAQEPDEVLRELSAARRRHP